MAADNTAKTSIEQSNGDPATLPAQAPTPNGASGAPDSGHESPEAHDLTFIRTRRARANDPRRSLNAAFAGKNEPPTPVALRRAVAAPPPSTPALPPAPLRRSHTFWLLSAILFALVAGSTFAVFYLRQTWVERAGVAPEVIRATVPVSSLQMHVEAQGERVLVSWNPRASGVQAASGGLLTIEDAGQHRDVPLDANQAANGSVLYRPTSGDVTFRLQIRNSTGAVFNDSLRVLDPAKAALAKQVEPAVTRNPTATRVALPEASKPSSSRSIAKSRANRPPTAPVFSRREAARGTMLAANQPPSRPNRTNAIPSGNTSSSTADPQQNVLQKMPKTPPISASPFAAPSDSASSHLARQNGQQRTSQQGMRADPSAMPPPAVASGNPLPAQTTAPPAGTISVVQARNIVGPDTAADGFMPPQAITQVVPAVRSSLRAAIHPGTKVDVKVQIDSRGRVKHAVAIGDLQNVDIGLQKAAIDAAKQWKFEPARLNGKRVESEHTIVFRFQGAGT